MATALSSLRASLRQRVGNPSTTALPDASADAYVNKGYHHTLDTFLHTVMRQEYTITTVAGTAVYTIPRAYRSLIRLWNYTEGKRVYKVTDVYAFHLRAGYSDTSRGCPRWYFKTGAEVRLFPTPDAVYSIIAYCKMKLDDLALDTDEIEIDDWDEVILARAAYAYYIDIGDEAKAKWALAVWKEATNNKPSQLEEETVDLETPANAWEQYPNRRMGLRGGRVTSHPWRD